MTQYYSELFLPLLEIIQSYLDVKEVTDIYEVFCFSEMAHQHQKRLSGEPYITHPVAVACILANMQMDPATIKAALMHDVVEDTATQKNDLVERFGIEVTKLVDGVTKLTQIHFENYAQAQAENFRKMVMAMSDDIRIIIIKLADRLHNMRTLYGLPPNKQRQKALETLEIFAPIANRLGMHAFRIELEDLGFSALYPFRYRVLKEAVAKARGNRDEMMSVIEKEIQAALDKAHIKIINLSGREKHYYSIYKKMYSKHLSFSEIMDVYGFRIIVGKIDTCYRVLGVLHNLFKPLIQRFKDYIAIPKANSYQSLHTTLFGPYGVPIEVQIRTEEMHRMAENGIAAHWIYKSEKKVFHHVEMKAHEWLRNVLDMDKSSRNSLEFIENVKFDLFPDEVYVFTPKGDIIELPSGATPVDFAYAIHSDIGNTCVAAKLDKRLAPLSTPLQSGQQVEIISASTAQPSASWLNFVVTGRARSKIRHYLKRRQRDESIQLGKRLLEKALQLFEFNLSSLNQQKLNQIVKQLGLDSLLHLYEEIGLGNRPAMLVAKQLIKNNDNLHAEKDWKVTPLRIKGTEGLVIHFSECCRPIPGDAVAGLPRIGQGIEVHLLNCPKLLPYYQQPDQWIPMEWEDNISQDFSVDLEINIAHRRGSLAMMSLAISEAGSNIQHVQAQETDEQHFHVKITVSVRDRKHLARVIRRLRNSKNVLRVVRKKDPDDSLPLTQI